MPGLIYAVEHDSIAEELGWEPGDEIVSINGHALCDLIDYQFYTADEDLVVIIRRGEEIAEFEVEKDIDDDLGATFEDALFDGVRVCGAKCIFCFVDQLPKGLRKSLYLKDDDYRLSFLHSNFVTLANVTDEDLQRIVTQRLSPLYISVHATNAELRERMLGRRAPGILQQIDSLSEGNITLHTQIVLCRGINDGDELDRTVEELAEHYPTVKTIAIVPAGVTAHRRHKTPIESIDAQYSAAILNKVRQWQRRFQGEKGTSLIWAADEFYLNSGERMPKASVYEGFPQIGNGIGLVRKFMDSGYRAKRLVRVVPTSRPIAISVVTGQLAAPVLRRWADSVNSGNLRFTVYPITNHLFGETVTVTGLIAGKDLIEQLRGENLGDLLVVPSVALREGAFLDDVTLADVGQALGTRVASVAPTPEALLRLVLELY